MAASATKPSRPEPPRKRVKRELAEHRFWTVPNVISMVRILLLIPLFYYLRKGPEENGNFWALVVMGIALFTDILDGLVARWFHVESDWGRVLDPVADKTWLGCLALFLALPTRANPLPWLFLALILARDITIIIGAYFAYRESGIVMKSNVIGKLAMGMVAVTLISYTVNWPPAASSPLVNPRNLMYLASLLLVLSGLNYAFRLRGLLREARELPVE